MLPLLLSVSCDRLSELASNDFLSDTKRVLWGLLLEMAMTCLKSSLTSSWLEIAEHSRYSWALKAFARSQPCVVVLFSASARSFLVPTRMTAKVNFVASSVKTLSFLSKSCLSRLRSATGKQRRTRSTP